MASVWFSVLVLISLRGLLVMTCPDIKAIANCNECIRCGGIWCNVADEYGVQCSRSSDDWCPSDRELPVLIESSTVRGTIMDPKHFERSILVEDKDDIKVHYHQDLLSAGPQKIDITIINSTIKNLTPDQVEKSVRPPFCENGKCTATVSFKPLTTFCPSSGTSMEYVNLRIRVDGVEEEATAKYHVPCACSCSGVVEKSSKMCTGRGDYSCGACSCHDGWEGASCEHRNCDRGDTPSECTHLTTGLVCSNHGRCLCSGKCECYTNTGKEYFGDYCEDICSYSSNCDSCLLKSSGTCNECNYFHMIIDNKNDTLLARDTWTNCSVVMDDGCLIEYAAMKDDRGVVHVMVMDLCKTGGQDKVVVANGFNVTVPVVLGLIAIVLAAAAAAGYMVWKGRTPPVPMNDPQYQNIDAEDCTGINPLYKPPTSSFKNPTYGNKW